MKFIVTHLLINIWLSFAALWAQGIKLDGFKSEKVDNPEHILKYSEIRANFYSVYRNSDGTDQIIVELKNIGKKAISISDKDVLIEENIIMSIDGIGEIYHAPPGIKPKLTGPRNDIFMLHPGETRRFMIELFQMSYFHKLRVGQTISLRLRLIPSEKATFNISRLISGE